MKSIAAVAAILISMAGPVMAVAGNDRFAQRKRLASQETTEEAIRFTPSLSYEGLDPLTRDALPYNDGSREGSLWWEWTAPRDGWFQAGAVARNGTQLETYVFIGESLKELIPVKNGNYLGLTHRSETIFEARAGGRYQIGVNVWLPGTLEAGNPVLATLTLAPCAGPPANNTLATRQILSGPLPLRATVSNVAAPTGEGFRLQSMTPVGSWYGIPARYGSVQWWEWTCPGTGNYRLWNDGPGVFHLVARRRMISAGQPAPAGDWETGPVPVYGDTFTATEGAVYDLAVMTRPVEDRSADRPFASYHLFLDAVRTSPEPPNQTRESAAPMPSGLPSRVELDWSGAPVPAGEEEWMRLWWVFTAPEDGLYQVDWNADLVLHFEEGRDHSMGVMQYFRSGEQVWIEAGVYRAQTAKVWVKIGLRGTAASNDMVSQAADMGSQTEFEIIGHQQLATMEAAEPVPPGFLPPVSGSMWWKWTAPADGWLRILDGGPHVPLEIFTGTEVMTAPRKIIEDRLTTVQAGQTYLIRALFQTSVFEEGCDMQMDFVARPGNGTWQTAIDLGPTALPVRKPVMRWPNVRTGMEQWFRWTQTEPGHFDFSNPDYEIKIYSDPGADDLVQRNARSGTFELQANQTYWMRFDERWTNVWFEMRRAALAGHMDAATAFVLPPQLPAAGTLTTRGDTNSEAEVEMMLPIMSEGDLTSGHPVVWWKWQAPADQRVRCRAEAINAPYGSLQIFSGETPQKRVALEIQLRDKGAFYFSVKQGTTCWFLLVGLEPDASRESSFRLELWPVEEAVPSNDNYANRLEIAPQQWLFHEPITGFHHGDTAEDPLRFVWSQASLEPGEPPVTLVNVNGEFVPQRASTWWHWTCPGSGIYRMDLDMRVPNDGVTGGFDFKDDLTANFYTGNSLESLSAVLVYERTVGQHLFRAQKGVDYTIRVASAEETRSYRLMPMTPDAEQLYDFLAVERLDFEDVGNAFESYADDQILNYHKRLFGLDPRFKLDHPRNAAALANLPRQVMVNDALELRCRPDPVFMTEGRPGGIGIPGEVSDDLQNWMDISPEANADGELVIRAPVSGSRLFLRWDVFDLINPVTR